LKWEGIHYLVVVRGLQLEIAIMFEANNNDTSMIILEINNWNAKQYLTIGDSLTQLNAIIRN